MTCVPSQGGSASAAYYCRMMRPLKISVVRWLPLFGLALFAALTIWLLRPPRPVPADAPAAEFSAGRAGRDVAVVARQRHPLGSAAQAQVRDYLLGRLRALGLAPTVLAGVGLTAKNGEVSAGRVQNIVARLPGRQPGGKAVLVLAHYDSQPQSPGAGDDGAGVAAMLETLRALRAGPPLAHDVIWLFTDGEEAGLLGARAYAADTARLRREVGVVLNFEGRGNAGPSLTFEVSPQNGWVVQQYARAAPQPVASSLFYEAYRHLANDTDFTPLKQAGLTGLNFAYAGGYPYYHSPADTPAHLDLGTLQHQGSYMLSLVRHFASIPLTQTKAPDYTFFNPLGKWLVRYPATWNLPLTLVTTGLLLAVMAVANHRRRLSWASLLGGALAWLGGLLLVLLAGWGLLALIAKAYPQYSTFYDHAAYNALAYQAALLALGLSLLAVYYGWLSRHARPDTLVGGALLVVAGLLGLLQARAASSAFVLALPLLAATLAWALRLRRAQAPAGLPAAGLVGAVLALPAVALLVPTGYLLLIIFGLSTLVLLSMVFLALLLGLLLPLLLPALTVPASGMAGRRQRWGLPGTALAAAVGGLAVGHFTRHPTADQPQQTHLFYALDADRQQAYWLSAAPQPDAWTRQVLTQPVYTPLEAIYPQQKAPVLHQAAPALALASPEVRLLTDSAAGRGGPRHLRLLVLPGRGLAANFRLAFAPETRLSSLRVAGQPVPADARGLPLGPAVTFHAPRATGELLELTTDALGPLRLVIITRSLGLPAVPGLPTLPTTVVPAPGYNSFTTQVKKTVQL
jgi:hypothetical protein